MKWFLLLTCLWFYSVSILSQEFLSPVNHEIKLAGTFGELRSNHFHMGIDIKSSNRASGDPIKSSKEGYVSRIMVSRSGYGNALYIDHPGGYTTVYGHLKSFNKQIDSLVRKTQAMNQSFEIDIDLDSTQLKVQRGELVGFMGNSGNSYGPHLHFEIRETETEVPLNPMLFGLAPEDDVAPIIKAIQIYLLDDQLNEISSTVIEPSLKGVGSYVIPDQKVGAWRIGLGIKTYDPMNSGYNKNGIYSITLLVDDEIKYAFEFDSISFPDSKYINAHIDYPYYKKNKSRFHRCYKLAGNRLPVYKVEDAIIKLFESQSQKIEMKVSDFAGNVSTVMFRTSRDSDMVTPLPKVYNYNLSYEDPHIIAYNGLEIFLPQGALYQNLFMFLSSSVGEHLSDVYHIGDVNTPLHKAMKIYFEGLKPMDSLRSKVCMVECSEPDKMVSYGGLWQGEHFISHASEFGNYTLMYDTIPPSIKPVSPNSKSFIRFTIEDNLSVSGDARGLEYQATIDGKWVLFEYDLKSSHITHYFDVPPENKEHILRLEVRDDRNNTSLYEKKFFR